MVSKCWFITSVCPSVCGCLEVDRAKRVPNNSANAFQTELVHHGSRLPIMRIGRPKCLTICLKSSSATSKAVASTFVEMKCVYFVSLSTTTKMAFLSREFGNPVIRSREMSLKGVAGISKGWRNPALAPQSCLIFLQGSHVRMYSMVSDLMLGQ